MKKIAILVASVLVLGGFGTRAFAAEAGTQTAQTTTTTTEATVSYKDEAGITPDSLLYTIDKAVDELRVLLATSDEKKAEVNAEIAQERLGESEVMAEAGKIDLAKTALEEYNKAITDAATKLQAVVTNLDSVTKESTDTAVEENTDNKLEQSVSDLEKSIQEVQDKSLNVLDTLKDVVGKDASEDVEKVIEEQTAHKEAVANFVKERHEFNAAKKDLNMAKVALKKVEKSGNADAVKAAQDKLTAAQTEYMKAKTELQAAFQAKKAADLGLKGKEEETVQTQAGAVVTADQNNAAVDQTVTQETTAVKEDAAKPAQYVKTNNGNGNGKAVKEEKEDKEKSAPGKSGEEHGKSSQAKGKNK